MENENKAIPEVDSDIAETAEDAAAPEKTETVSAPTTDENLSKLGVPYKTFVKQIRTNGAKKLAGFFSTLLYLVMYIPVFVNVFMKIGNKFEIAVAEKVPYFTELVDMFFKAELSWKDFIIRGLITVTAIPFALYVVLLVVFMIINIFRPIPALEGDAKTEAPRICTLGGKAAYARYSTQSITVWSIVVAGLLGAGTGIISILAEFDEKAKVFGSAMDYMYIIFAALVIGLVFALAGAIISLPLRILRSFFRMSYRKSSKLSNLVDEADAVWLEVDPEEKARREKAEKERREREEREKRESEAAAARAAVNSRTAVVVYYDDSIDPYGNLSLTLYIDGSSHNVRPGKNVYPVSPGSHILNCTVYNDGSETATTLDTIHCYVDAGEQYEVDIPA